MGFTRGEGERGGGRLGRLLELPWGEEKEKKKRRGAGPVEKTAQEAWREKKVIFYFKSFYKF
jgi:hypothetical protein